MQHNQRRIESTMGSSTPERIVVKGFDLPNELLGHVNFGDMAFLELMDRLPTEQESIMFNAMLVTLVEHGITPSAIATRLTYLGAPESLQSAVAAGLLGLGSVFVGTIEGAARMLVEALGEDENPPDLVDVADRVVAEHLEAGRSVPGIGHPLHKPVDPRSVRLFELAREHGFDGDHPRLMELVSQQAEQRHGKQLPVNATGAIGAIAMEMGMPWEVSRGMGVMARAVGLVGHIWEEIRRPFARQVWSMVEEEAGRDSRG